MHSKLIVSTLVAASLLGAPVVAFAQTEPAQPKAPVAHHKMSSSHMKAGTTTGMSSSSSASKARPGGESVARKPAGN
jgi:hypothetical protein